MLKTTYDAIVTHLQKNLDKQDFYKNIQTEIDINENLILFLHPWYIKDVLTGNDVFPEKAQTDIDKEFEPSIALYLKFSMKENKQELACFKELDSFTQFKEIKDFGSRMYAIDFGTDIEAAASAFISVAKNVFNIEQVKSINIITIDTESSDTICEKTVHAPQKAPAPIKVDGVATRVVEETKSQDTTITTTTDNDKTPSTATSEGKVDEENKEQDTKNDPAAVILCITIILILFLCLCIFVIMRQEQDKQEDNDRMTQTEQIEIDTINTSNSATINVFDKQNQKEEEKIEIQEESPTEIIGKWRETTSGSSDYIWILEKNKSTGKYHLTVNYPGGMTMEYKCIKKKIKKSNSYLFHDPDLSLSNGSNGTFTLKAGETIYFIPGFDGNSNAILMLMPGNVNRVYTNDIDNRYYEFFANLQSIN